MTVTDFVARTPVQYSALGLHRNAAIAIYMATSQIDSVHCACRVHMSITSWMVLDEGHSHFSVTELICCRNAGNSPLPSNASGASSSLFLQ